jgi:late competence protein required for DNA uptake (superfamily II DNA/RNA helicase)
MSYGFEMCSNFAAGRVVRGGGDTFPSRASQSSRPTEQLVLNATVCFKCVNAQLEVWHYTACGVAYCNLCFVFYLTMQPAAQDYSL